MSTHPFYIVDVFAEEQFAGNQLAVIRHARELSSEEMQRIANEMHFSETTFILSDETRDGGYDVRIFTPEAEVPFAGHPTLGTAYIIAREILQNNAREVKLNLQVGQIPVTFDQDILWMKQIAPKFGERAAAIEVAPVVGIESGDIDARFPCQTVSTGLPFLIVPLKTLEAVKRAQVLRERLEALLRNFGAEGVLIFAPETYDKHNQLNVRVFVPELGVPEDPATGSGNGCLASYLARYKYFGESRVDIRVEQGYEIGRPSLLLLRSEVRDDAIEVNVGGRVQMVARGELV